MFFKTALFLFGFIPAALLSQIEDSVLIDPLAHTLDSSLIIHADSIKSSIDSLVTLSEKVPTYIYQQPFSYQSTFITKTDILRNDYRYSGDFFKAFPFSFERSYGFIGQPNDIYLYAEGSSSTSYFMDGVPTRITDFNQIQSEDIDSIEIVPLPRGFLYGFTTNLVSVNFISKDIIPTKPYSRVKYYEGAFGEAFIDGIFSMNLFKNLNASVDITNRKVDDSFKNSAFSIWQVNTKLRYNLSNYVNLIGSYYFSKSETGLNGGVNVDAIKQTSQDVNSILYNETLAPVYYEKNKLNFKQHNFSMKLLAKPFENAYTNLHFYYKFYLQENSRFSALYSSRSTLKNKTIEVLLDQRFLFHPMNLTVQSGYQFFQYKPLYSTDDPLDFTNLYFIPYNYKSFFISPLLSVSLLDSIFVPSIYFKHSNISQKQAISGESENKKFNGYGIDISAYFNEHIIFFAGYSAFENELMNEKLRMLELKLMYKDESGTLSAGIFSKKTSATYSWGIGLTTSYMLWKILIEGGFSKYFYKTGDISSHINIPQEKTIIGVFYKDFLFNSNLDLKAGFIAYYTAKQNLQYLIIPSKGFVNDDVPASFTIDFTVSAEIQKTALVYFTWENLFNKKYYITPYYPMLGRNIRFGVAWEIFN